MDTLDKQKMKRRWKQQGNKRGGVEKEKWVSEIDELEKEGAEERKIHVE